MSARYGHVMEIVVHCPAWPQLSPLSCALSTADASPASFTIHSILYAQVACKNGHRRNGRDCLACAAGKVMPTTVYVGRLLPCAQDCTHVERFFASIDAVNRRVLTQAPALACACL